MRKKENNNLVCAVYDDGEKRYFTSTNRAAATYGICEPSVKWCIKSGNTKFETNDGRIITFELVDGSEIPYKLINNN